MPFTKNRERIQRFREAGILKHLYRNESNKACFAHDAEYSDSKGLAKRTISDKILIEPMKFLEISIWWISKNISEYGL